jgi:hypothetical protein
MGARGLQAIELAIDKHAQARVAAGHIGELLALPEVQATLVRPDQAQAICSYLKVQPQQASHVS